MSDEGTTRLRLDIAYDGTAFSGWGKQPKLRTVQGELESAIATVFSRFGPSPTLTVAGRTDAGVHATGQVAHLDLTPEQLDSLSKPHGRPGDRPNGPQALARRLNGIAGLNSDVYVRSVTLAPPGFDARFSAVWRRYEYRVADARAERNPLTRNHVLWLPVELDVDAMNAAAQQLLGLHDFAAYCKPPPEGSTTIRTLQEFTWERGESGVLLARLKADAFCHSMVRSLVGATIPVGEGRYDEETPASILRAGERTSAFKVLPAKGLVLVEIGYPPDDELATRAEQTRARRPAIDRDELTD